MVKLLLLTTLGRGSSWFDTLGRVAVLVVIVRVVGCIKFDNTTIALLILLSVNGILHFRFTVIAAVSSSNVVVGRSTAAFYGDSNFDGMHTHISMCLFPLSMKLKIHMLIMFW